MHLVEVVAQVVNVLLCGAAAAGRRRAVAGAAMRPVADRQRALHKIVGRTEDDGVGAAGSGVKEDQRTAFRAALKEEEGRRGCVGWL